MAPRPKSCCHPLCLAPLLYTQYTKDCRSTNNNNRHLLNFADDIALISLLLATSHPTLPTSTEGSLVEMVKSYKYLGPAVNKNWYGMDGNFNAQKKKIIGLTLLK